MKLRYCDGGSFSGDSAYIKGVWFSSLHKPSPKLPCVIVCENFLNSAAFCSLFGVGHFSVLSPLLQRSEDMGCYHHWPTTEGTGESWKCIFSLNIDCFTRCNFGIHIFYALESCVCILQVLLSGCSAGGLATFFHCDSLKERLGGATTVKCLSDAGFFLDL